MHLLHHHRGGGDGHPKDTHDAHKQLHRPPRPCYRCGREFLKSTGGLAARLKYGKDHCPACHSRFDLDAEMSEPEKLEQQHEKQHHSIHVPSFLQHSLHKKSKSKIERTSRTPAASSFDSMASECDATGTVDEHDVNTKVEHPSAKRSDSCPFAFTYETEEVESYQISHEDATQEIESYQMEWLLNDAP